mmetsp:Transcript_28426/g.28734  ORF Transcript_28426/g.28734 Transcript_28426/m.28734 type:complete len:356 (-) Transcript_28426:35-1102(-)|eukprot:CAMPEP_0182416630 /NCGR_PEP_ID=MMETSP1167-20130531/988_1 /TAXON_ID=2988 /ORGANISM="Mallomonas Sp, Strain CCMP3275" /LENGTH=355 /DNA_ID=CAMNT_0024589573 /DNA_START=221 /DNA_END=1288 /DNA_ORIENTATION=-
MFCLRKAYEQVYNIDTTSKEFSLKPLFDSNFGLNDLELLETIGTGSFSRVRLVRTITDPKYYALKIMKKTKLVRMNQVKHVQNEVHLLAHLDCKFVVNLHAVFQDESSLFLLLAYVPGGELYSYLRKRHHFDEALCKFYTVEVASAIDALHAHAIAYRDIKPENILIAQDGHIRLVDFGFAKIVADRSFTLCGTPEYLAPEVVLGTGHGRAVDWWALGVLCYEMLAGYPPFTADNPFSLYQCIQKARVIFPPQTSAAAQVAIRGFLTVDRANRLGCKKGGLQALSKLPFFKGINWQTVAAQQLAPPIVPVLGEAEGDTSNFDTYPEEKLDEISNLSSQERDLFKEFDKILDRKSD